MDAEGVRWDPIDRWHPCRLGGHQWHEQRIGPNLFRLCLQCDATQYLGSAPSDGAGGYL